MRGEHTYGPTTETSHQGSSPLARGTPDCVHFSQLHAGIIPACAGNTRSFPCRSRGLWDHPRLRGEHPKTDNLGRMGNGSSPLARGTPRGRSGATPSWGIIPACAGNTLNASLTGMWLRDHPRLRGEHWMANSRLASCAGSSPLARGTHGVVVEDGRDLRIIPACAGNTTYKARPRTSTEDHPRLRGEHSVTVPSHSSSSGSSPLARGTRGWPESSWSGPWIIPACAGNT